MKYRSFGFLISLALMSMLSCSAQHSKIRLIVRGDDMGFTHSGNLALVKTFKEGIERSIEVIIPSPWFPEAKALLKELPGVDVGIHLALTSEWENIKWRPVTYSPSLTDSNGYFFPMIYPNKNYSGRSLKEQAWKPEEIEQELRAQIEIGIRNLPNVTHLSAHMGCNDLDPKVNAIVQKLAKEFKIDINLSAEGVEGISYKGPSTTGAEKLSSFLKMIESLQPGKTYLFVDHPALDGPEMRAIHHIGYENVAEDRQGVTDVWTNAEVMAALRKKNVQLISYGDLRKK